MAVVVTRWPRTSAVVVAAVGLAVAAGMLVVALNGWRRMWICVWEIGAAKGHIGGDIGSGSGLVEGECGLAMIR